MTLLTSKTDDVPCDLQQAILRYLMYARIGTNNILKGQH